MNNFDRLSGVYKKHLKNCIAANPNSYMVKDAEVLAARMLPAIKKDSFNKDSPSLKLTCKELGIPFTYKGIREFIKADEPKQV